MEGIAEWLAKISWPLVSRVLVSLGFGYTTYEGADTAITNAISSIQGAFAGLGAEVLQLLAMAGFFDAMSITSGGIVSGLAWMVMKRFALQTTGQGA
ncbi:conserved hypothetical protein [Delftia acidovorans SPH-1]|jgi:Protein of unknown function (DUF2523).|uniref:DUF2523 domain-containing protein n=1 Tax=Delftia acidovorans (strain DSM 14801 / SPH-1) TaxID=398578 RepID=A9BV74_DELAS|nr:MULTISPECIES: DUF2523 domain-containing protein [Pseudomonadota]OLE94841.1 MAG: hypothetical protein AUI84_07220 [Delftia sp. 13_1_40CM_3_66_6]ABX34738.1 conserved hypothetical protein [Delftia acidovorans SPH-1]ORU87551.1 hypothetical protein ACC43_01770 [Francisella tularensis subsp. holarctica]OWG16904.1 hypothetical protein KDK82_0365 [Delftia sp. K82]QPS75896.1 DUF2523 domain-containing protein [Delftia acidovorans]